MTTTNSTIAHADLVAVLAELGDTAADVARTIRSAGVTGRQGSPNTCPVANYLSLRTGYRTVAGLSYASQPDTDQFAAELPLPVKQFVQVFDAFGWAGFPE